MKKYLSIVIIVICTFMFVACQNNLEDSVNNDLDLNIQESGEKNDIEKYKLGNEYVLTDDMYEVVNLYNLDEDSQYEFESDNTDYVVKVVEDTEKGKIILLNDVEVPEMQGQLDGVFDFNTADSYKELVVTFSGSIGDSIIIYRVKADNEIEVIGEFRNVSLIKIGERCVFPQFIECIEERVICGYYEYINDKFVFVDRFLNGEKLTDISKNFINKEYTTTGTEKTGFGTSFPIYENGEQTNRFLANNSKIKILNIHLNSYNEIEFIDIELKEDSMVYKSSDLIDKVEQTSVKSETQMTLMVVPIG